MTSPPRIYLSPPHMEGTERARVAQAFDSNWISSVGPHIDAMEQAFCEVVGCAHAVALNSGTSALHLALHEAGVGRGDEVLVSTFTFVASVNPVLYVGATPVFIDSERTSWNMDPALVAQELEDRARRGSVPAAVIVVHLYGQSADLNPIHQACQRYGVPMIEDAAEALGATYRGYAPGTVGHGGVFSFNGNKIITTSAGGMYVTDEASRAEHVRKLAAQARDDAPYYQHSEVGYNYRMSNICAAIGRAQLDVLDDRVAARRANYDAYLAALGELPGLSFQPEAPWGRHTRWLTCVVLDPERFGCGPEEVRQHLEAQNIEARRLWKPMHMQPLLADAPIIGGDVAHDLFARGLCLPSGSNLTTEDRARVIEAMHDCHAAYS